MGRTRKYKAYNGNQIDTFNHVRNGRRYVYVVKWLPPGLTMPRVSVHKTQEGAQETLSKYLRHMCFAHSGYSVEEVRSWPFERLEREAQRVAATVEPPRHPDPRWKYTWSLDYAEVLP